MRVVVSFSLFGEDLEDVYYGGAIQNAEMYGEMHPDWECRYYVGKTVANSVALKLEAFPNTRVIYTNESEDQSATFWRFLALRDTNYDAYLFRDVDGRPMPREMSAVQQWLGSEQQYHVMRDHPRHGTEILAGLWGVKASGAAVLAKRLPDRLYGDYYQIDQDFLRQRVWRHAKWSLMTHLGCQWTYKTTEHVYAFPVHRSGSDFYAGECRLGDGTLRFPEHRLEVITDPWRAQNEGAIDVSTPESAEIHRGRAW